MPRSTRVLTAQPIARRAGARRNAPGYKPEGDEWAAPVALFTLETDDHPQPLRWLDAGPPVARLAAPAL